MKIITLSFCIKGKAKVVNSKAKEFMLTMGTIMGKEINGVTLIQTKREDNKKPESIWFK